MAILTPIDRLHDVKADKGTHSHFAFACNRKRLKTDGVNKLEKSPCKIISFPDHK